jgi:dihydroorotate dehydrogenase
MLYRLVRPLLFALDPERVHKLSLRALSLGHRWHLSALYTLPVNTRPVQVMGLTFANAVGLAAGLDKNGAHIDALGALGFGFVEVGTVTPRPQPGNPKPRIFRLRGARALINRLGFNNDGVDALVENVKRSKYRGIIGINIGKNADTPNDRAADDYLACLRKVYAHASYVTVNISSPNTKNLRDLQQANELAALLRALKSEQAALERAHNKRVPLVVKLSPDLNPAQLDAICDTLLAQQVEGVIATNTTTSRGGVDHLRGALEAGGLSGAPLFTRSNAVVRYLAMRLKGRIPIIGVGGILTGADAREKLAAGASLVQIYTGLIYRGPRLIQEACAVLGHNPAREQQHAHWHPKRN